jgi:hypothetical protein
MTSTLENPTATASAPTPVVTDNARYAWDDSSEFCLDRLPADFVGDYRAQLDAAGVPAMELELARVWAEHGYRVEWVSVAQMGSGEDRIVPNTLIWDVWAEAARRIDETALVAAAELNDELNGYRELDD